MVKSGSGRHLVLTGLMVESGTLWRAQKLDNLIRGYRSSTRIRLEIFGLDYHRAIAFKVATLSVISTALSGKFLA